MMKRILKQEYLKNCTVTRIIKKVNNSTAELFGIKDVAKALGYSDTDQAIRKHCKRAISQPVKTTGRVRNIEKTRFKYWTEFSVQ